MLVFDIEFLVKKFDMIFVECVVRNLFVGFLVCRLGVEEGKEFNLFIFEFFLKNDVFYDLMVNDYYILLFGWVIEV